jgi:hypothetical protein
MKLACVGNALVDVIAFVETDFSSNFGFQPGSTSHVDHARLEPLLAALFDPAISAGWRGGQYSQDLCASWARSCSLPAVWAVIRMPGSTPETSAEQGLKCPCNTATEPTGVFLRFDSPGWKAVGGCQSFCRPPLPDRGQFPTPFFPGTTVLYLDGFLAAVPGALEALASRARTAGMKIALDVAGHGIATAFRDRIHGP